MIWEKILIAAINELKHLYLMFIFAAIPINTRGIYKDQCENYTVKPALKGTSI